MQSKVTISFDKLVEAAKTLPKSQWKQLRNEVENESDQKKKNIDLEALLLNGPTATKKQLNTIDNNRKSINQWRTKS